MKRRMIPAAIAGAVLAGTRFGDRTTSASPDARSAEISQIANDAAACRQMLVQLMEIQNVTQQQAADVSPQIVSAGGGPISVGGVRQCQSNQG